MNYAYSELHSQLWKDLHRDYPSIEALGNLIISPWDWFRMDEFYQTHGNGD